MNLGRKGYEHIAECNKPALRELFGEMIGFIQYVAGATTTLSEGVASMSDKFRNRFEAAMRETIPSNEPCFLIRGQDECGDKAVTRYANVAPIEMFDSVMAHVELMRQWPKKRRADL